MTRTIQYVVWRRGANAANQPGTLSMPIGIYYGSGHSAREWRAAACLLAQRDHTVYANQILRAVAVARSNAETIEHACEYQQSVEQLHQSTQGRVGR